MRKTVIFTLNMLILGMSAFSQETPNKFGINFTGFVRADFFYDTRQVVYFREGSFLMYPENIVKDPDGTDINAKPTMNFLAISTRVRANITSPDVLGAKVSGAIEGEFFGHQESDVNGFRLRHAFVKMNWAKMELLMGQYWHPFFIPEAAVIPTSFNTGAPFQPVSRFPQIRLSRDFGKFRLMGMIYTERDHTSYGPNYVDPAKPIASGVYVKNAAMPDMHLQLQYKSEGNKFVAGAGIDYKTLMPETYTTGNNGMKYNTDETISSLRYGAFTKITLKPVTLKAAAYMGENTADMVQIGGYACSKITDSSTTARAWANISTSTVWLDISNNNPTYKLGLYMGYSKNLGAKEDILTNIYCSRGMNIDMIYRVSPRFTYAKNKLELCFELEYTTAAYGTNTIRGRVTDTHTVSNLRPVFVVALNF